MYLAHRRIELVSSPALAKSYRVQRYKLYSYVQDGCLEMCARLNGSRNYCTPTIETVHSFLGYCSYNDYFYCLEQSTREHLIIDI